MINLIGRSIGFNWKKAVSAAKSDAAEWAGCFGRADGKAITARMHIGRKVSKCVGMAMC